LAVEIHQSGATSSDIAFDLALQAERFPRPRLTITRGAETVQLRWPGYAQGLDLYSATNLVRPVDWRPILVSPALSNSIYTTELPALPGAARFYRLQTP